MKQDEMKLIEKADEPTWQAPILEEIDVALITRAGGGPGPDGLGAGGS
jgi:hypothetical protein